MKYEIVPCRLSHLSKLSRRLRHEEVVEVAAAGQIPRHMLYALWQESDYSRAVILDGECAAVWGMSGPLLSADGEVWLFTSQAVDRVPMLFVKTARASIAEMLKTKHRLMSGALACCDRSLKFWQMLGFSIETVPEYPEWRRLVMER